MTVDVLKVFGLGAVDVARQVEVEVVLRVGNLGQRHHPGVARDVGLLGEGVDDAVDVLLAQAVLVAVLDEPLGGVDHEHALAGGGVLLVEHHDAGGDAGAVEEVGGQADDALEIAGANELLADRGLGIAAEENAMGQDAGGFARALHRADDVQQVGVVALLGGRLAPGEALEGVLRWRDAGGPGLVGERRIGDDVVVGAELLAVLELGRGQGVAREDVGRGEVVQDHVHAGQARGGHVLLLPFERDVLARLGGHLQEQRARAAGRVVGGGGRLRVVRRDADHPGDDAADLGGGVELPLALATLGGEVPHQVLVGVAEDVVVVGAVLREVELGLLEDADQVGQAIDHRLAFAELVRVVEVGKVAAGEPRVGVDQRLDDLGVDLVADVALALEGDHVLEARALRDRDRRGEVAAVAVLVGDVLDEQHEQDVVLVLAGIHAAAQLIAGGPERGVEVGFLDGHDLAVSLRALRIQIRMLGVRLCHGIPYRVMQRIGGWCRRQTLELRDGALSAVSSSGWLDFHCYCSMTMLPSGLNFHWSE